MKKKELDNQLVKAVADELIKRSSEMESVTKWEVPLNYNDTYPRKAKLGSPVTYDVLRSMSRNYEVARMCINIRKRQISQLPWQVTPIDEKSKTYTEEQIKDVESYIAHISGHNGRFRRFTEQIVEDLLVLDAAAIYKRRTLNGALLGLLPIDASTIKLRVDSAGLTPQPPAVAYEQWIRGEKIADMTTDDMMYEIMNPRTDNPYGLSVMESLIMTVESALKGNMYTLAYFTDGTIPAGFYQLPEDWKAEQIKQFQTFFDAFVAGDARAQRKVHFMPGGGKGFQPAKDFKFDNMQPFMEWLMRLTAAMFNVSPQELGFTDTVNRSNGEEQTEIVKRNGIRAMATVIQDIFNSIIQNEQMAITDNRGQVIKVVGPFPELKFQFTDIDPTDEKIEAEIIEKLIPLGAYSVDEWRREKGLEPIGLPHYVRIGNEIILASDIGKPKEQPVIQEPAKQTPEAKEEEEETTKADELKRWEKKALSDYKAGRPFRKFYSDVLDEYTLQHLGHELTQCTDRQEIKKVFRHWKQVAEEGVVHEAERLYKKLGEITRAA